MKEIFEQPEMATQEKTRELEIFDAIPEKETGSLPVLFAPEWSDMPTSTEKPLESLSAKGYRVLSLIHDRKRNEDIDSAEMQKALSLLQILEEKGLEKVDAVGYSEAGINLCMAVMLEPEKFRNIILFNPTGMSGRVSMFRHFVKYFRDVGSTILSKPTVKSIGEMTSSLVEQQKYILKNPALALKEITEITKTDIADMLEEIKKKGIHVAIISSADDKLLLMDDIQRNEKLKKGGNKKMFDGFYSIKGTHHNLITNPEDSMFVIDQALRALEQKSR